MLERIRRWIASHPYWALAIVTVAALLPFLSKPFNIDDPLFIWAAKQIQAHPANPYGFVVNWYDTAQPMWSVTENPPLTSYFLALAAKIFGWNEIGLHFTFLLPAIAAILGTYRLAKKFCGRPFLAALATLFTPVFLVSSTTVMCDVPMLAFWIWAIVFWVEGTEQNNFKKFFFAALLVSFAAMTKYFGACLIPLLAFYSIFAKRKFSVELFFFLIPLAVLAAYELATFALYGHALFFAAANYAAFAKSVIGMSRADTIFIALTFSGGCLAMAIFFAPLIWRARTLFVFVAASILISIGIFTAGMFSKHYPWIESGERFQLELQMVFWVAVGISILALVVIDFWRRRDASACLLFLWVAGVFCFTAFFNWTVNARSILPMAPVIGILIARRLEMRNLATKKMSIAIPFCVAAAAALAIFVARSDFLLALAARESAEKTVAQYGSPDGVFWCEGHWGFQFYIEQAGALELDKEHSPLKSGDRIAVPLNNTGLWQPESVTELGEIFVAGPSGLTVWNGDSGAGFYASRLGPLPFIFGCVPAEKTIVYSRKTIPQK